MDELFTNLDPDSRNTMLSVLNETLSRDKTIFVINHAEMNDDYFSHKIRVSLKTKRIKLSDKKRKKLKNEQDDIIARISCYEHVF